MKYLKLALFIASIALLYFSVSFTSKPEIRYAEYHCHYNAIFNTVGKVDYVTVGGSRSLQGVGAPEFADYVKKQTGQDVVVVDLSRSWRGQGVNYILVRDMLENHKVGTLVVEANLAQTMKYHERFHLMARFGDFFTSYTGQKGNVDNRGVGYELLVKAKDRVMNRISKSINGTLKQPVGVKDRFPATTSDCMSREELVNVAALSRAKKKYKEFYKGKVWSWDWNAPHEMHNTRYYEELVSLAQENNIKIVFYYVHQAYYKRLDPLFAQKFEDRFGAPLFIPPDDLVDRLEPLYADQTHMVAEGRKIYTDWLAQQVLNAQ